MPNPLMDNPSVKTAAKAAEFAKPLIMGVVNCTPDSFHEASRATTVESAVEKALKLAEEGADILDFGGQSTRPGSESVDAETELSRVIPVIQAVAKKVTLKISVDTDKASVAEAALGAGATIINDVTALRGDKAMAKAALKADRVILMHMLGLSPKTMQADPVYKDCFLEVSQFLEERLISFIMAGGRKDQVWIDPGIGFGKTLDHNLVLIKRAGELSKLSPVVLGVSRKSMFSKITPDSGPQDRLAASLAVASHAFFNKVAVLRVHDVLDTRRAIDTLHAVASAS